MVDEEMEEMEKCNRTGECSESVASTVCAHNICLLRRVPRYINRPPEHTSPHRHHTPEPPAKKLTRRQRRRTQPRDLGDRQPI